jgi:hypothetical protein
VQPSKFGIHAGTRSSFTDTMYEIITVVIGKMKQITANALKFVHIDFLMNIIFSYSSFLLFFTIIPTFLKKTYIYLLPKKQYIELGIVPIK